MGRRWRRLNERFRQQLVAPHFQPASIERNQLMFREASNYANHFKTIVRKLTRLLKDYEDWNGSVQKLLESRAPRLYTIESDGSVGAELRDGDEYLGMGIQTTRLESGSHSMQERITEEVLNIFQKWFKSYEKCKVELQALTGLRLELDSRQRTVISLDSRRNLVENKIEKEGAEGQHRERSLAARDLSLTQTAAKLEHKEGKYNLCLKEFRKKEEELNQQLRSLLSEVSIMTELLGHVYRILSESPQDIYIAFRGGSTSSPKLQSTIPVSPSKVSKSVQEETKQSPVVETTDTSNPFLTPA